MIIKEMLISVLTIMARLKIVFALVMQTLPISKNMASVITVAVGVLQRMKQRCELQQERLQKNIYANILVLKSVVFKSNRSCENFATDHRRN